MHKCESTHLEFHKSMCALLSFLNNCDLSTSMDVQIVLASVGAQVKPL